MITITELRMKEVINLANGKRIGYIQDLEINLENNRIDAIILPKENKFLKIFSKDNDYIISWKKIVKIGQDVILVDIKDPLYEEEKEFVSRITEIKKNKKTFEEKKDDLY
ncbi:sporulation protein, YlmC/YmxH family [Caminicella sporogenes DSM 14501]|uniref:Sporulation protein, YlmC/YmxH family n=1 Tax=Caminicella sporogenes DSM 14501 TaxID=1121266 RepID=A0A1M6L277_9FIRM|nr:YlmC/YmxH family sporulation protein [Caminicella sporogenes]RKD27679.1 hypothetical protein BET04_01030 [Caminicella sporogenes]WIF94743.1 YlmC/YmxH family sporulation protein [Caminicella sporogenes]SHJ65321.1 sporulation protein, YlmC/YmxH family [Caminicella sporogenes DSM 14501]